MIQFKSFSKLQQQAQSYTSNSPQRSQFRPVQSPSTPQQQPVSSQSPQSLFAPTTFSPLQEVQPSYQSPRSQTNSNSNSSNQQQQFQQSEVSQPSLSIEEAFENKIGTSTFSSFASSTIQSGASFESAEKDNKESAKQKVQSSDYASHASSSARGTETRTTTARSTAVKSNEYASAQNNSGKLASAEWIRLIKSKTLETTSYSTVKHALQKGIKRSMRPRIWMWLGDIKRLSKKFEGNLFERLASTNNARWDAEIKKDVPRTLCEEQLFSGSESIGQKSLFRILNAFSNFDTTRSTSIGYAQGMNIITGILLLTFHDSKNHENPLRSFGKEFVTASDIERWVFWLLVFIMHERNHSLIFQTNMAKRYQLLDALKSKLEIMCPKVLSHLNEHSVELGLAFDAELFSILAYRCPIGLAQFAFDHFLLDGHAALIDIQAKIILHSEKNILQCKDLGELMAFLQEAKKVQAWEMFRHSQHQLVTFQCLEYLEIQENKTKHEQERKRKVSLDHS